MVVVQITQASVPSQNVTKGCLRPYHLHLCFACDPHIISPGTSFQEGMVFKMQVR
jgi:hypothetical protein